MRGVDGMFYYKIVENEKKSCLSRDEVLNKYMMPLIVFYEKHLKFNK